MQKEKGYLLPDTAYTEDMACTLVYYPDKPEYRRALLGSLTYLATWIAWEKESEHKGIDAALCWKIALDLTVECWQMACLEQLQSDVAEIVELLKLTAPCCDLPDVTGGDQYTDRVEDGVGDVPQNIIDAGYASDAADWDGFDDYKCMISHVIVDQLNARLIELAPYVDQYSIVIGGLATIAAIITTIWTGGLTAIAFGLVASTGAVALLYQGIVSGDLLEILAAKVVTNHDELVCAVYRSDGDEGALVALNDKIDELFTVVEAVILKNMNLGPTLKALYAGRHDQQDMAEILFDAGYELGDFDCTCEFMGEYQLVTDWETVTWEGWDHQGGWLTEEGRGGGWCFRGSFNETHWITFSVGTLLDAAGLPHRAGTKIWIHGIKFWYKFGGSNGQSIKLMGDHDGGSYTHYVYYAGSWTETEDTYEPPLEMTYNLNYIVKIRSIGSLYYWYLDDITIDFDYEY